MDRYTRLNDTLTAAEALEEFEKVTTFLKWDKRMIGVFCKGGLLVGKYDRTLKEWVVQRDSLKRLIGFIGTNYSSPFGDKNG